MNFTQLPWDIFGAACLRSAQAHARAEYPNESCGAIVDGAYVPFANIAANPREEFEFDARALNDMLRAGKKVDAIVHSHPGGNHFPSHADMEQQIATDVPWVIVTLNEDQFGPVLCWGDSLPKAPLLGRPFVHGIFDCYSAVRDYYALEHGIDLPQVPRGDDWWNGGGNLYLDHFEKFGFRPVALGEVRPGDAFLCAINSAVPNHAGVLMESGMIFHHLPKRLSRRETSGIWANAATMWIRHEALA